MYTVYVYVYVYVYASGPFTGPRFVDGLGWGGVITYVAIASSRSCYATSTYVAIASSRSCYATSTYVALASSRTCYATSTYVALASSRTCYATHQNSTVALGDGNMPAPLKDWTSACNAVKRTGFQVASFLNTKPCKG